jgi:hypothetical protein
MALDKALAEEREIARMLRLKEDEPAELVGDRRGRRGKFVVYYGRGRVRDAV